MGFLDFKRVDWEIFSVLFKDIKFEPMLHNSYSWFTFLVFNVLLIVIALAKIINN